LFRSCGSYRDASQPDHALVFESGEARGEKAVRKVLDVRGVNADIIAGQTLPAAAAILLPEDLHCAAQEAAPEGERSLTPKLEEPLETSPAHGRGKVVVHERRGGVGPAGIREGVDGGEVHFTAEADGCLEIGLLFGWEAGDYVCRYRNVRNMVVDKGHCAAVLVHGITAAHAPEHRIRPALEGKVEVRAETAVFPEVKQRGRNVLRLKGREADARDGGAFEKAFEQTPRALIALSCVPPVIAELCAGQNDFLDSVCLAGADFRHDAVDRNARLAAARVGDDAESAELVAAFLDLDKGPRAEVAANEIRTARRRVAPVAEAFKEAVRYFRFGGVRKDRVRPSLFGNVSGRGLGVAACENDVGIGRKAAGHTHEMPGLAVGDVGDRARVDYESRSAGDGSIDYADAISGEAAGDDFRISLIQLAAEGEDRNGRHLFARHHQPS